MEEGGKRSAGRRVKRRVERMVGRGALEADESEA